MWLGTNVLTDGPINLSIKSSDTTVICTLLDEEDKVLKNRIKEAVLSSVLL